MERQVNFENEGRRLTGIAHIPQCKGNRGQRLGLVFLHGRAGYRIGPHQMFVKAARRLCADGFYCLRFDFRGHGDSEDALTAMEMAGYASDAAKAIDFCVDDLGVGRVILLGICLGGAVAIEAAQGDERIAATVLWSTEAPAVDAWRGRLRRTRFLLWDYAKKLSYVSTWRKIVLGRVNAGLICKALVGQFGSVKMAAGRAALHAREGWAGARGPMLFIYGGNDPDAKAAVAQYGSLCRKWKVASTFHVVRGANHSFCSLKWEKEVIDRTVEWIKDEVYWS